MATTAEVNAAATTAPGTVPPGLDTPVPESEDGDANSALVRELEKMKEIMKDYEQKLKNLQKKLDEQPKSEDEMGKEKDKNILKPIHVKDVTLLLNPTTSNVSPQYNNTLDKRFGTTSQLQGK